MIGQLLQSVISFVSNAIGALGYTGVAALMAIESALIPLPSAIIMPFSGFLVAEGRFTIVGVTLAGAFGNLVGGIVAYALGYFGGRPLLDRYGHYLLIRKHELNLADRFFQRWGGGTVFVGRVLPIVRTYISLPAGIARMNFALFCLLTFIGSIPWSYALAFAGMKLGENWEHIRAYTHWLDWAVAAALVGCVVWLLVLWLRRRGRRN